MFGMFRQILKKDVEFIVIGWKKMI